jgi:hypothetical protein
LTACAAGRSAEEIAAPIGAMQAARRAAVEALREIGTKVHRMNEVTGVIAAVVEQQGSAAGELGARATARRGETEGILSGLRAA